MSSQFIHIGQKLIRQSEQGQLVVEYILLLIVSVSLALLITTQMVSRNSDRPGIIITAWTAIVGAVANDNSDSVN